MTRTEGDSEGALESGEAKRTVGALVAEDELDRTCAEAARPVVEQDRAGALERRALLGG